MAVAGFTRADRCLLCEITEDLEVEHVVPQRLWKSFGIHPKTGQIKGRRDLPPAPIARFCTTFCRMHNEATGKIHNGERDAMMKLISEGRGPATEVVLHDLADWAVWVTMLLGLARSVDPSQSGGGVLSDERATQMLKRRFDEGIEEIPEGMRVYAARVDKYDDGSSAALRYMLALTEDQGVILDWQGNPSGFAVSEGTMNAAEVIGLGDFVLLVLGQTYSSGDDHDARLDEAVASAGLELIFPLPMPLPTLDPKVIDMNGVARLLTTLPFGDVEISLLPEQIRVLWTIFDQGSTGEA